MILLFLLITPGPLFADVKTEIIEVEGFGVQFCEAVQNGLIEALKQTKGVAIDSKRQFAKAIKEKAVSKDGQNSHQVMINERMQSSVREVTQGIIHEYRIVDSYKDDGQWGVKLEVKLMEYKTPGFSPHKRRKMAVIPFRTKQCSFNVCGKRIPAAEIAGLFTQKLVTEFTQTRKFTVLDRDYYEEFLRERDLILSPDTPVAEQMKIGEVLGVDYLVVGTISDVSSSINQYKKQLTGETGWERSGLFIVDYRIIVMATRQIKWSDSVKVILENDDYQRLGADRPELMDQAILKQAAGDLVSRAMDNIYPLRVAEVQPHGQLILNQGGTGLQEGLLVDVFRKGKKLRDPYTGEFLGFAETLVGTAEIVRVTAKISYARIIDAPPGAIFKGDICRRTKHQTANQENTGKATDVLVPDNGGVVLPFD
ncbi:MAG: hypothetical protein GY737_04650 [Desulfobacteraceae bacterium]|nr:hypothetical protein [Desulfobacteraceae bacterium]